jgi:branched-chain amino acid transport system permease protein
VWVVAQDGLAGLSPEYWQFWLGAVLVVLVLAAPGGLLGGLDIIEGRLARRLTRRLASRAWR